ncbi:GlxA family transcriptional regulator [Methylomicrobium agile]|uniref:GlxA family transcriptional regulator n=1 Tax=Methylomicrobium agile TaxID=39774 RepID=UPI00068C5E14|nr:GlxA family transcriptional regulator [Methylomicrobium agile]
MTHARPSIVFHHRRVAMVVYPNCEIVDVTGPMDVFCYANYALRLAGQIAEDEPVYSLSLIAERAGPVKTASGMKIFADFSYDEVPGDIDTLMVTGAPFTVDAWTDQKLTRWLPAMLPKVRRMVSICTGAFLLAESGLLNNRKATTHWLFCEELANRYRNVQILPDKIFVRDGSIYTSGGVTAGIDLALSLVEDDWGWEVAADVARAMLIFMRRPGGQSQFSSYVFNEAKTRKDFRELQAWIVSHPDADLSVEALADRMAMSPRNFSRVFCQEIGVTPAKFVERTRLEAARNLILRSDLPMESIAGKCGFNNAEQMRRTFQRFLNISPQEYRANFK